MTTQAPEKPKPITGSGGIVMPKPGAGDPLPLPKEPTKERGPKDGE